MSSGPRRRVTKANKKTATSSKDMKENPKAKSWGEAYSSLMIRHPFKVNGFQAAVISALGTLTTNAVQGSGLDMYSLVKLSLIAGLVMAPASVVWYGNMAKTSYSDFAKLMAEWFIFTPFINLVFFSINELVDTQGLPEFSNPNFWIGFGKLLLGSYCFWMPFATARMQFCPAELTVAANTVGSYAWQVIYTYVFVGPVVANADK
mmetsp:Transcript_14059/g.21307  ORF Transcript_14059/g.21307 Transcript_14059/m.21307 type:complete len:205 (+) Transcript_14059:93-707(+)